MTDTEVEAMQEVFAQTDAIFSLEGFDPTEQSRAIETAVLAGRVTLAQVAVEMRDYAMQHKTTDGFIQSRAWA
jgi:hypothetical protein